MILDHIKNYRLYAVAGSRLERAFRYITEEWTPDVPDGRVDVDGDNVYALVQGYPTRLRSNCRFEAHRRYLDIQWVWKGAEGMSWVPTPSLIVAEAYDPTRDVAFFRDPAAETVLHVTEGLFTIFYPEDAHAPGIQILGETHVKKVVMKVALT